MNSCKYRDFDNKKKDIVRSYNDSNKIIHLKDTIKISGEYVLFLRPDSLRFLEYTNEGNEIYELYSDFGYGISATFDTLKNNPKYDHIQISTTDNRYIYIYNCKSCPLLIDRDTIDYGLLLVSRYKEIELSTNVHSNNYIYEIEDFFFEKIKNSPI